LHSTVDSPAYRNLVVGHKGVIVQSLPMHPVSQIDSWDDPKIVFLTEQKYADPACGIIAVCLALAIPVVQSQWINDCIKHRKRLPFDDYILPVQSSHGLSLSQPIEFAKSDTDDVGLLTDESGKPQYVKLIVVGRDGYEISDKTLKNQLKNIQYLVGLMGGGVAQETRRHYFANIYVIDHTRDGATGRGYNSLTNCSPDTANVTVHWLFESLIKNKLLPLTDFIYSKTIQ